MTIKVVEVHFDGEMVAYPVEANKNWIQESKKLLHFPPLFVGCTQIRDPEPEDDLEEMLDHQYGCFIEFADKHRQIVSDERFNAGIDFYCKTLEALPDGP